MLKKTKKYVAIVVMIGLLGTASVPVVNSFATEGGQVQSVFGFHRQAEQKDVPNERLQPIKPVTLATEVSGDEQEVEPVYEGSRLSLHENPEQHDWYSLTAEQMEQYLQEGFTIADLYEADAIANELIIDPEVLLSLKKEEEDWEKVKATAQEQNAQKIVKEVYSVKYPKEYKELSKLKLSSREQLMLLSYYDRDRTVSMKELTQTFQEAPSEFLKSHADVMTSFASRGSRAEVKEQGASGTNDEARLKAEELSLSERELEKLQQVADISGLSLEELAEKYHKAVEGVR